MRELKFRAWSKSGKKMIYNIQNEFEERIELGMDCFSDYLKNDDFIVEQYTGLKDKNGKMIYEGDIVKMPDWAVEPKYKKVSFVKLSCGFEPFVNGCFECVSPDSEEVEVIGNIHDNPELLEDRNN